MLAAAADAVSMTELHKEITAQLDASSGERIKLRVAMKKGVLAGCKCGIHSLYLRICCLLTGIVRAGITPVHYALYMKAFVSPILLCGAYSWWHMNGTNLRCWRLLQGWKDVLIILADSQGFTSTGTAAAAALQKTADTTAGGYKASGGMLERIRAATVARSKLHAALEREQESSKLLQERAAAALRHAQQQEKRLIASTIVANAGKHSYLKYNSDCLFKCKRYCLKSARQSLMPSQPPLDCASE